MELPSNFKSTYIIEKLSKHEKMKTIKYFYSCLKINIIILSHNSYFSTIFGNF